MLLVQPDVFAVGIDKKVFVGRSQKCQQFSCRRKMLLIDPASCLAVAIYFEARGERLAYQMKVGEVIMNRVDSKHYSNTICEVIKERKQFSFLWDNIPDKIKYGPVWDKSVLAATNVLLSSKRSTKACHYAHTLITNYWTVDFVGKRFGNHIFYTGGC